MTTSALVLIPPTLLLIVLLLGFTGCAGLLDVEPWRPSPEPEPPPEYSPTILAERTLVAYWPLGEKADETKAVDVKGGRNGDYESKVLDADSENLSAAAPGTLTLGKPGIVAGDPQATCIEVDGGFVSVPFDAELNPNEFSIEAWVHVGWSADSPPGVRIVMVSYDAADGVTKGFGLAVGDDNIWKAQVGAGAGLTVANGPSVVFDTTNHLVLTYNGSELRFFLNGAESTSVVTDYEHSTESKLLIGIGGPQLPEERQPWVGKIQCVALYSGALNSEQVAIHFQLGIGGG
jgi:hypothetical protein